MCGAHEWLKSFLFLFLFHALFCELLGQTLVNSTTTWQSKSQNACVFLPKIENEHKRLWQSSHYYFYFTLLVTAMWQWEVELVSWDGFRYQIYLILFIICFISGTLISVFLWCVEVLKGNRVTVFFFLWMTPNTWIPQIIIQIRLHATSLHPVSGCSPMLLSGRSGRSSSRQYWTMRWEVVEIDFVDCSPINFIRIHIHLHKQKIFPFFLFDRFDSPIFHASFQSFLWNLTVSAWFLVYAQWWMMNNDVHWVGKRNCQEIQVTNRLTKGSQRDNIK